MRHRADRHQQRDEADGEGDRAEEDHRRGHSPRRHAAARQIRDRGDYCTAHRCGRPELPSQVDARRDPGRARTFGRVARERERDHRPHHPLHGQIGERGGTEPTHPDHHSHQRARGGRAADRHVHCAESSAGRPPDHERVSGLVQRQAHGTRTCGSRQARRRAPASAPTGTKERLPHSSHTAQATTNPMIAAIRTTIRARAGGAGPGRGTT